jgi:hypothetical protein
VKRVLLLAVSFVLFSGFTLQWDAPTKYVDGTNIVGKTIYYDAWADGAKFVTRGTTTSAVVPDPGSGVAHLYEVAAIVDNVASAKAGFNWTSPLAQPAGPANLRMLP